MTGFGLALVVGVPLLVLQKHLQADRRVDSLVEQIRDEAGETRADPSGEGPEAGRGALSGAPSS